MIVKRENGYYVLSEKTKSNLGGPYKTREEAEKRLRQIEFFKHHKGNKGQAVIFFVFLIILVIGAGAYFGRQYFIQRTQPSSVPSSSSLSPTPLPASTFQELLTKNCKSQSEVGGTITINELPVRINPTILKEILSKQNSISCQSIGVPYTWYVDIGSASLYDHYSKELGHGGRSYFSKPEPEQIIKKSNDISIAISLNSGSGQVGDTWIAAEGIKRFELSNGQVFYADFGDIVIDLDDPRLIALLKQYAEPIEGSDDLEITKPGVEQAIIKQFFSNLEQIDTPEKETIAHIERILNGISLK